MALTSAMEDYLEAVFMLQKQNGYVRCVDVAKQLRVRLLGTEMAYAL